MAPSGAPYCADWRLTWATSSCCAGSQLPQGEAPYCGLGLRTCAEICAFTLGLRLSSEPNFSLHLRQSPPWPRNQPFLARLQIFFGRIHCLPSSLLNTRTQRPRSLQGKQRTSLLLYSLIGAGPIGTG
ncbi:uncharacterized protein ACOB8E_011213 isoform 1-T1 [Sarcophilus harrisii]